MSKTIRKLKHEAAQRQAKATHKAAIENASSMDILDRAIADITAAIPKAPSQSKESAANALAMLMRAERELFPPDAKELAEIACQQGIRPEDFAAAILKRSETSAGQ